VGAISHNTSFTHCLVLNLILAWFGWKLVGNLSFSTNLWLTTFLSLSLTKATKHGWLSIKHLVLYYLFHNLFLYFLFFFFNFPSFYILYFFFFYSFFFYFLLQRMLILLGLSWCHKFQLHSCPSCLKQRERLSRFSVLKWSHAHLKRWWQEFVRAISHNISFTHCHVLNLILAWFGFKLVGNLSCSTNLWLTTLLSLS